MNAMRPIYPGEVLKEELSEISMTTNAFAQALHVPAVIIHSPPIFLKKLKKVRDK